jgi:hypothetical protein
MASHLEMITNPWIAINVTSDTEQSAIYIFSNKLALLASQWSLAASH